MFSAYSHALFYVFGNLGASLCRKNLLSGLHFQVWLFHLDPWKIVGL